ncbi:MAG: aspartate/glutamate racemase family protein [Clostridia bacterium]|nr:aspartate/glutamate racemase family protein [Clostridia bacterium]
MGKHVMILGTSTSNHQDIKDMFKAIDPSIRVNLLTEDSLIQDILANEGPTPSIIKRMCAYAMMAQEAGADLIVNQCSSVSEVADIYEKLLDIPVLKVDQPMAEKAVELGSKIALVTTNTTTVGPSRRLIERCAAAAGKEVEIVECVVDGAMEALFAGDAKKHNDMLRDKIIGLDGQCDVIVLAQGSMIAIMPEVQQVKTPVLTSIPLMVERAVEMLKD